MIGKYIKIWHRKAAIDCSVCRIKAYDGKAITIEILGRTYFDRTVLRISTTMHRISPTMRASEIFTPEETSLL